MKKIIKDREDVDGFIDWFKVLTIPDAGWMVEVKMYEPGRTLSQNGLFWLWMSYLVENDYAKNGTITKEDWHDYFVSKFIGWTKRRRIGGTIIEPTLKHTSDLLRKEMTEFMYKIEVFCAERNILLPIPEDAVYLKFREEDFGETA